MTNQEAIKILGELKLCYLGGIVDAIDMAIEAVKAQEAVKPYAEYSEHTGTKWLVCGACEQPMIKTPFVDTEECSNCRYNIQSEELETPYCPLCGAKMDEEAR